MQPLASRSDHRSVIIVGIVAHSGKKHRKRKFEFPDSVGIPACAHQPDGEDASRGRRIEMLFADARDLALQQRLRRFELSSVCPNCGEHSTIVRMSSTAIMKCNNCGDSMLQAV